MAAHVTAGAAPRTWRSCDPLGADEAIDYRVEDFAANGQTYDVVFDGVGKKSFGSESGSEQGGSYVSTDLGPYSLNLPLTLWTSSLGRRG